MNGPEATEVKRGPAGIRGWAFAGLLAAAVLALYAPVLRFDFVAYDDPDYVTGNRLVQAGLTWPGVTWACTTTHASNWHPLTWLSHMLDAEIFGPAAAGPHGVNLAWHAVNSALVFLILRRLTDAVGRSAFVAALFALHPLRVESVAWIAERKDVLSAFFFLLTLWAYVCYVERRRTNANATPRGWYLAALAFFAAGLMCKPMLVTLPAVLLLLDGWPLRRITGTNPAKWGSLFQEKLPFFALSMGSCVVTFAAQRSGGAIRPLEAVSLVDRIGNAFVACARYLGKTFWPEDLAFFYPHPGSWPTAAIVVAVGLFAALSLVAIAGRNRFPWLPVGWFWFVGMLVPVIGLVQAGAQAMADRYTYLPSIGLLVALGWGGEAAARRLRLKRAPVALAACAVVAAAAVRTAEQLPSWRDSEALFRHALTATRENHVAHNNLGGVLLDAEKVDEAIAQFDRAVALEPAYADAHSNLARALLQRGRIDEAVRHGTKAVALAPGDADFQSNLGNALLQQGDAEGARVHYEIALRLRPDHLRAHNNLGWLLFLARELDEAAAHFERALAIDPGYVTPHVNLADLLLQRGDTAEAIIHYETALALAPNHDQAAAGLARARRGISAVARTP